MNKKVEDSLVESVLTRIKSKEINYDTASILLRISKRQVYRLINSFDINKEKVLLVNKPCNKTPEEIENKIIDLYKTKYCGFSHTHFHEKLQEIENININFKTLQRILNRHLLISPYSQKETKKNLKSLLSGKKPKSISKEDVLYAKDLLILDPKEVHNRYRHITEFGALIQLDARSDKFIETEIWFLHLAIDVGKGIFVGAYLDREETLNGYQHVLHQICSKYGIPKCILTDNRTVFEYLDKNSKQESKNTLIQFKYSCICLGINLQTTSVATYKALIERGNGTFGRRLPQEFRLHKITDLRSANLFLEEYLDHINARFIKRIDCVNVFRKSPDLETLNNLIGNVARRTFDKACCIKYKNEYYYATINNKIVDFKPQIKCLFIKTFDGRYLISVDSVLYVAKKVSDMNTNFDKEANPEGYSFLRNNKVTSTEFVKYSLKNRSTWSYKSFDSYVSRELYYLETRFK